MSILPLSVRLSVLISLLIIVFPSSASVVMTNTRVIYPSDAKERSVQLKNNDSFPNVVQVWTDINNSESTPENADGPFLALPAIFRIEPNRGQLFRLIYSGGELPKDRESLFYLNFLQIPPLSKDNAGENQMLVMLKNRVKIFYRPVEIKSNPENVGREISFNVNKINGGIEVDVINKSPFYASFVDVKLISGNQELKVPVDMVEPKGNKLIKVYNQQFVSIHPMKVKFTIVNDFGGFIKYEYEIK
ncbi:MULTISPECIES: fimbrial biogenesis chaperone [Shewanella]|uniref:Gram-negative pili assembly c-terminal domain protein n=1 Tax=Shewanella decolorationis S12 TaxID=1353536 RepID=A0ABP2Z8X0_9GAMM|nr:MULTISPECIES: molecular chaperone [Shewanella]ESE41977.1 gram-negative pili assembly c-terminal domain protein [Shewanella decolorationis S12]MDV5247100.1 molecular chaperone [Shewanella xiamenensis]PWH02556.1 molecular chaperone [Shewanella xiamenensis]